MEKKWKFKSGKAYFGTEGIPLDVELYETTDIYEGAYLLTMDAKLKKVELNLRGRKVFVFEGENLKERALGFINNEKVNVRDYAENVIKMKDKAIRG